jgi:hypothetical protein
MRLQAFRIRNFRSIVDSGWQDLSEDHITALLGQNEAGKTTVLEALHSFRQGILTTSDIRSDLSEPSVSCSFSSSKEEVERIVGQNHLHPEVLELLSNNGWRINLTRRWNAEFASTFGLEETALVDAFKRNGRPIQVPEEERERLLNGLEDSSKQYEIATKPSLRIPDLKKPVAAAEPASAAVVPAEPAAAADPVPTTAAPARPAAAEPASVAVAPAEHTARSTTTSQEGAGPETPDVTDSDAVLKMKNLGEAHQLLLTIQAKKLALAGLEGALLETQKRLSTPSSPIAGPDGESQAEEKSVIKPKTVRELQAEIGIEKRLLDYEFATAGLILAGDSLLNARERIKAPEDGFIDADEFMWTVIENLPRIELFIDNSSLLPNQIDVADIVARKRDAQGLNGVLNLLTVIGLEPDFFTKMDLRIREQVVVNKSLQLTNEFGQFWQQTVGRQNKIKIQFEINNHSSDEGVRSGKPYYVFWVTDGDEKLYPVQRSQGVRWFLSFFLQLQAMARLVSPNGSVLLIDEPGHSLHARAQEDVLKVFEKTAGRMDIIYTAHSPFLFSLEKLHRILAVQRTDGVDGKSYTKVLTAHELSAATTDTLTPIFALIGVRLSGQQAIKQKDNVLLEEISAFYYLKAFSRLTGLATEKSFLPCQGVANVPLVAYLLLGWGLEFSVVVDDESSGRKVYNQLKKDLFHDDDEEAKRHMLKVKGSGIEDLFSKADFSKHVFPEENSAAETPNSERMKGKGKGLVAMKFMLKVERGEMTLDNLDQESRENIKSTMERIAALSRPKEAPDSVAADDATKVGDLP